jgi:hypothetical protein
MRLCCVGYASEGSNSRLHRFKPNECDGSAVRVGSYEALLRACRENHKRGFAPARIIYPGMATEVMFAAMQLLCRLRTRRNRMFWNIGEAECAFS